MAAGPAPRLRADAARNRRRLLEAAAAAVRRGDDSLALNGIAKAAGVGIGTAYRHFATRSDLVVALAADEMDRLSDAVRTFAGAETVTAAALVGLLTDAVVADPALALLFRESAGPAHFADLDAALELALLRLRRVGGIRREVEAATLRSLLTGLSAMARVVTTADLAASVGIIGRGLAPGAAGRPVDSASVRYADVPFNWRSTRPAR